MIHTVRATKENILTNRTTTAGPEPKRRNYTLVLLSPSLSRKFYPVSYTVPVSQTYKQHRQQQPNQRQAG